MSLPVDKTILIGVLVILFLLLVGYGWNSCTNEQISEKEGFTNPTSETNAPTRASDCRCLPGYIPSNKISKKILGYENGFIEIVTPLKIRYGIDNQWVEKVVSSTFRATNSFFGRDPAPGLRKRVETVDGSDYYFCQSLSNPLETRKCY